MKKIFAIFVFFLLYNSNSFSLIRYSTNPDACTEEGVCLVPKYAEDGRENYAIVSPVGYSNVKMISQAKRLSTLKGKTIATMNKGETAILVTGDASRNKVQVMPGGDFVTVEIKLPKNWNELVAPLGYEPIENFYL